jgi:hypothetical protein
LEFGKDDGVFWGVGFGGEYAINAKGGLFDFDGGKLVNIAPFGWFAQDLEKEAGHGGKNLEKDGVGFHGNLMQLLLLCFSATHKSWC